MFQKQRSMTSLRVIGALFICYQSSYRLRGQKSGEKGLGTGLFNEKCSIALVTILLNKYVIKTTQVTIILVPVQKRIFILQPAFHFSGIEMQDGGLS